MDAMEIWDMEHIRVHYLVKPVVHYSIVYYAREALRRMIAGGHVHKDMSTILMSN